MTHSSPILVLGMHRSGTSATAALLAAMGAFAGEEVDLLPAHPQDNPAGYWERNALMLAHDEFLRATGHAWDRVAGFDVCSVAGDARRRLENHVRALVDSLQAHGGAWLIKDPRLCLLLPLWLPIVGDAACVVVVRDPREIAASLRDTHRGVLTSQLPIALWEKYTRVMLDALKGRQTLFVSYSALLTDTQQQTRRLQNGLEALGVSGLHAPLNQPVSSDLHRRSAEDHIELSAAQAVLYDWLLEQTRAAAAVTVPPQRASAEPDRVLAEFEAAFDAHIEIGRTRGRQQIAEELHRIEIAIAAHAQEREHSRVERAAREEHLEQVRQALAVAERERDGIKVQSAAQAAEIERLSALAKHASGLESALVAMRSSLSWKLTAPVRWIAGLAPLRMNFDSEQRLYRFFYALPGMNVARKRSMIVWLHEHASWLTRHTLSYQLYQQAKQLIDQQQNNRDYRARMQRMDERRAAALIAEMRDRPLISIIVPVYNVERRWLVAAVESVRRQFYPHWELCLADDASTREETQRALREIAELGDERIRIQTLPKNLGIAGASNAALAMATGEYVGLLDNDDELSRDALLEMARCIDRDHPDFLYSDEDKIDEKNFHVEPHFKPDFSPDFLASTNYICHFSVAKRELLNKVGGFRAGFDGAQDYDLVLRICEQTQRIAHIPLVLYHWRKIEGSTSATISAKPQTDDAGRRALAESLRRRSVDATAEPGPAPNTYRVRHAIRSTPRVSIIIPFRDKPELLDTCISSILEKTGYTNYEILCVDNGSVKTATQSMLARLRARDARVRVVRHDVPFNYSNIINFAAGQASGEHLLFLNNDTKVISAEWLEAMLEHSQRPEIGVVGAKLLYEDNTVQHAGVIVGLGGVAGHSHLFAAGDDPGYFRRIQLIQNLSAVTFACAMTRRAVFEQVGGLNERDLKIAFNDVDYCLRVREAGYQVVYTPFSLLYHFESKSRGQDDTPEKKMRFDSEIRYFQKRHATILTSGDPYYNPNLTAGQQNFAPMPEYVHQLPL